MNSPFEKNCNVIIDSYTKCYKKAPPHQIETWVSASSVTRKRSLGMMSPQFSIKVFELEYTHYCQYTLDSVFSNRDPRDACHAFLLCSHQRLSIFLQLLSVYYAYSLVEVILLIKSNGIHCTLIRLVSGFFLNTFASFYYRAIIS